MRFPLKTLALLVGFGCAQPLLAAQCAGTVGFGEANGRVLTQVANRAVGAACFNDLIIDTDAEGANYGSHGEFVAAFGALARDWRDRGLINGREYGELVSAAARSNVGKTLKLRVIAFNDFHGNIDGSTLTQSSAADGFSGVRAGGVDYLAGLVKQLRDGAPNSVVVSAGDLIGASPLNSALFHDEPTIETMNRLGLDFNAVGNHEFDEGKDELLRMKRGGCHPTDANSCQGNAVGTPYPFEGAAFDFLAANVVDSATGDTVFPAYGIKEYKGIRVAFIGMTLKGTPSIVTPGGIVGLRFGDEADTVNALIGKLKDEGVNAVVVLVHEGGYAPGSINGCSGISGPITDIVKRLDDAVDLVVSGHTHAAYNCTLPNRAGRAIPVTSAGNYGRLVTRIDLVLDTKRRDVIAARAQNLVVDRNNVLGAIEPIVPDAAIAGIVANYNALTGPIANRVIGNITATLSRSINAAGESVLGDLIADGQLLATAPAQKGGAVVAFMNPGGIRADFTYPGSPAGEGDGQVTYGEAFTVQPFGNSLVVKTLSGQQLYDLLEQQWAVGQPASGRILQVSDGFHYRHTFSASVSPLGGRYVCDGSVTLNGVAVDKAARYRVTMNSFLATGGDNFSVFSLGTEPLGGDVDLDALTDWFALKSPAAPTAVDRIVKVASCN
ncbi:bifunctional metallophosphatase/5'-nucleotidase [Azoarcus olearius]|uniref:5'-nucleotidase n=1 Tax=Azoarcus sp. (strain BH72) TaxID=418699 RepID=A1K5J5_AZOSB|nr:bifunctional metallophosphatase/5'-nucleotidase [Azoarcus olearius]CAL94100.1 5'-nucleotidase [Azoarcus olearius]